MDIASIAHIPAGAGEVVGDTPDRRVEILSDDPRLNATWSRFGPRREGADLHVHRRHQDLFYVLDGEFTIRLGPEGEPVALAAGSLVRVPPLVVHGFRNASDADVRYLNFHAPGRGFSDYLRDRRDGRTPSYDQFDPPADGGRDPAEAEIGRSEPTDAPPGLAARALTEVDEIRVAEVDAEAGAEWRLGDGERLTSVYVLAGELLVARGGASATAEIGSWVQVSAGEASVTAPSAARFLELRTPHRAGPVAARSASG